VKNNKNEILKMSEKSEKWEDTLVAPSVSKNSERCAHYFTMLHDLDLANMALVRMAQHQSMRGHEDSDTVSENIYFDYALMHYFRCFGTTRHALGVRIFETLESDSRMEARRLHNFFKDTYDMKIKRPDDIFSQVKIGIALEEKGDKEIKDVFWLMNKFQICKPELTKAFSGLVSTVKTQVEKLAKESTEELLKDAADQGLKSLYDSALKGKDFSNMSAASMGNVDLKTKKGA
jgi:hypothetical protein